MNPHLLLGILVLAGFPASANTLSEITSRGSPTQTHNHSSGLYPPELAMDGDPNTFSHTASQSPGAAWELHYSREYELARVEIVSRDCCAGRLNGATLRLFDAEAEMVFEVPIVDGGPLTTFTAEIPTGTLARDLRIGFEAEQGGIVHLAEVRVFAPTGDPPEILSFTATPNSVTSEQTVTLNWTVTGATAVELRGLGPVSGSGSIEVTPAASTTYFLTATNDCDRITNSTSVVVDGTEFSPRITEFSALPEDWVELWNPGSQSLSLAGWHLTDDPANLQRWAFEADHSITGGGFLLVEHPFGLAREAGSYLALVDPSGTVVSAFTYPEQFENVTYGSDLDGNILYFIEPTPGDFNRGPTTEGFLKGVTFSVERGLFTSPFSLALTPKSPGATVHYSLDGSDPVTEFTSPIPITTTTVVRATEVLPGYLTPRSEAHTYLFPNDITQQPEFPSGFPADWQPPNASGALAPIPRRSDYEMDPEIVNAAPFPARVGPAFDIPEALRDLPSMCLTLPVDEMWDPNDGLHANALLRGRSWEREISMELIDPRSDTGFHTNCGLRIHGGRGRVAEMLKKSFRLYFRGDYGAKKFDYPLFDGMPAGGVDHLVLRGGNGKTWASPWRALTGGGNSLPRVTYLRDQFLRDTQSTMGQPAFAGTFVHLYLNGLYWGLYNPVERPGGNYAANHFGGKEEDYDFFKWANGLPPQVINGDLTAWHELLALTRNDPAGNWTEILARLDVDNLADYLIANFYVGNIDWIRNNAYGYRPRPEVGDGRYRFLCWDGEESLLSVTRDSTGGGNNPDTPMELHNNLRTAVSEYRLRFADRIHRHLVDEDGALLTPAATARHDTLADLTDKAIAAESARWGDLLRPDNPYTHDGDWLREVSNLTDNYLTQRPAISLSQMKADDLYPDTVAPIASLLPGGDLKLDAPEGTIWFTTDGSDPRTSPSAQQYDSTVIVQQLVNATATWRYLDDGSDLVATEWNQAGYDDQPWAQGAAPLGYGRITNVTLNTTIDYGNDPLNRPITTYLRHQFQVTNPSTLGTVELQYFRDDGVVIYLNGLEIERSNLPLGQISASTPASELVRDGDESTLHSLILPSTLFQSGDNILAVELHQEAPDSSDLGFGLSLTATREGTTLQGDVQIKTRAHHDGEWSALEEEYFRFLDPAQILVVSEIMYHPLNPSPAEFAAGFTEDEAFEFIEVRNIGNRDLLLDGIRFSKGVDVTLTGTLAPGAAAVVVANRAAFELRYGSGLQIVGEWEAGDRLDNGGERIRLRDAADNIIREFAYEDGAPWPTSPDGAGPSLILMAPATNPDHGLAQSWRASSAPHGNPGTSDHTSFPGGNPTALLEYATRATFPLTVLPDGAIVFSLEINPRADDVQGRIEISHDLVSWQDAHTQFRRSSLGPLEGDYALATFTSTAPLSAARLFVRYSVSLR